MKKLIVWFDNNIFILLSFVLIFFIPLYPKIPLFDIIPGYIVRVRAEDFLILISIIIFFIQFIRKKANLNLPIFYIMLLYLFIGFLSIVSAVFISKTIPFDKWHILKALLHWLRRAEYFSIFFIFYNGVKKISSLKKLIYLYGLIVILVSLYGYGQKYYYWPVYSTMNREFAKGVRLYLTEHARVPSTFGGHYDLAAFLVIFLVLFAGLTVIISETKSRFFFLLSFLLGYWLLILSASRTSFIAYLGGLLILALLMAIKKNWLWSLSRFLPLFLFSFFVMLFFGDLSERFAHLFRVKEIKEKFNLKRLISPFKAPPVSDNYLALDENLSLVLDKTDERPVTRKPIRGLPPDVYEDIPDYREASLSAEEIAMGKTATIVAVPRRFSENAYKYGLSAAIRMDALWPRAIAGFKRNPLLGSGYSTLTKESVVEFTEAESTDNEYLRILGETGLLGFLTFFSLIFFILKNSFLGIFKTKDSFLIAFFAAFFACTIGLLINALYIDVFTASKVAFTYWALAGMLTALFSLLKKYNLKAKNE